jgi:hypothetical protein
MGFFGILCPEFNGGSCCFKEVHSAYQDKESMSEQAPFMHRRPSPAEWWLGIISAAIMAIIIFTWLLG